MPPASENQITNQTSGNGNLKVPSIMRSFAFGYQGIVDIKIERPPVVRSRRNPKSNTGAGSIRTECGSESDNFVAADVLHGDNALQCRAAPPQ